MSNLFAALSSAAGALSVFENALSVTQNNIANSSTPGYARQSSSFEALPFDSAQSVGGGVRSGPVQTARDVYSETAVQTAQTSLGTWQEQVNTLQGLQTSFDITGENGIPGALNKLFDAFSAWSAAPAGSTARQGVLNSAQDLATAFQQESAAISAAASNADSQLSSLTGKVNALTAQIQQDNLERSRGRNGDPAVDADLHNSLEQLAQLVPITTLSQADGSTTVLLAGQTPLVVGQFQYSISSNVAVPQNPPPTNPSAPPSEQVLDSSGNDITASITSGRIGGLLQARNGTLAQLQGDAYQQGSLNQLAQGIADRVNALLTGGNIANADPVTGAPAVPGVALFSYDAANPTAAARTLVVNPAITPAQLAAIDPGPPEVDNGISLKLASLATPQNAADEINNASYTSFFGNIAAQLGSAISTAQNNQTNSQDLVTQASNLRQQSSGVDLNTEAISILKFQQSYNAAAKIVAILDELTKTIIDAVQ
jgi:flagellar hook-associated protein 1 FlgK